MTVSPGHKLSAIYMDAEQEFQNLANTITEYQPGADLDMLKLAFEFAQEAHQDQNRASGEAYIFHPLAVAQKLAEMKLDAPTIIAGLLHDIPEDTEYSISDIEKQFGKEVATLVSSVTKLGKLKYRGIERYAENLRKMFIAMSNDIRVILIKFADRIHNLKTLGALPPEKQLRIAHESLEIYSPIANRLGISKIKGEIEDLSFKYANPKEYAWINDILPKEYASKEKHLEKTKKIITQKLSDNGIAMQLSINGRTKHIYSLYKKLLKPGIDRDLSKVFDLIALRVIVNSIADCYSALGIIHELYKPVPGRIKDYIAQPKPNGYQSIHTTIFTDDGEIVEVQIRTEPMHEEAEYGIAAHWHYKEHNGTLNHQSIKWIKDLVEWQKNISDNEQFIQDIKLDIFQDRIFIFTPKGDVFDLPDGSTPVDFAYHVHSSLGDKCVGSRVNGIIAHLSHKLKSGDVVEIITDKKRKGPSIDWLEFVKTSMARGKIKSSLNKQKITSRNFD